MYEDVQTRWQYEHVGVKRSAKKRLERLWHGSRDSSRTPVQWDDTLNAGFSETTPWFYVNENYKEVNVNKQENDENSILNFYRKAIKIRKELNVVKDGIYKEYNKLSSKVYMYSRENSKEKVLVICSYSEKEIKLKVPSNFNLSEGKLILNNYENNSLILKPYETRVYLWKKL